MHAAALDPNSYAIVIGNSKYEGATSSSSQNLTNLNGPDWDSRRMQEEFEARGFTVFHYVNMSGRGMQMALDSFCGKLTSRSCMRAGCDQVRTYATGMHMNGASWGGGRGSTSTPQPLPCMSYV